MPATKELKFTCAKCSKEYRWKPELAGKQAKCKCGAVITVPSSPPPPPPQADEESDLDGLYSLAAEEQKATRRPSAAVADGYRCPSCGAGLAVGAAMCPSCGMDMRTGKKVKSTGAGGIAAAAGAYASATPTARGGGAAVLAYGGGKNSADAIAAKRREDMLYEGGKAISLYLPLGLITLGVLFYFGAFALSKEKFSAGLLILFVGARVVIDGALMLLAMVIAVKTMDMGFGAFGPALLKIVAIAVGPGALGVMVEAMLPKEIGWLAGGILAVILYYTLIKVLFNLDLGETLALVGIIYAVQRWVGTFLIIGLMGLLASGSPAGDTIAAVAVGAATADARNLKNQAPPLPTPEELRAEMDEDAQHALNWVKGGTEAASFLDQRPERMFSKMDNPQSIALVKEIQALGCTEVRISHLVDFREKSVATQLIFELPKEPEARKKVFEWRAKKYGEWGIKEEILGDKKPYRDVGQTLMVFDLPPLYRSVKLGGANGDEFIYEEESDAAPSTAKPKAAPETKVPAPAGPETATPEPAAPAPDAAPPAQPAAPEPAKTPDPAPAPF